MAYNYHTHPWHFIIDKTWTIIKMMHRFELDNAKFPNTGDYYCHVNL